MTNVVGLNVKRVQKTNSPRDWKLSDLLNELLRRVNAGELPNDLSAVLVIERPIDKNKVEIQTFTSSLDSIEDAAAILVRGIRAL